jgi:hypothetical protein
MWHPYSAKLPWYCPQLSQHVWELSWLLVIGQTAIFLDAIKKVRIYLRSKPHSKYSIREQVLHDAWKETTVYNKWINQCLANGPTWSHRATLPPCKSVLSNRTNRRRRPARGRQGEVRFRVRRWWGEVVRTGKEGKRRDNIKFRNEDKNWETCQRESDEEEKQFLPYAM